MLRLGTGNAVAAPLPGAAITGLVMVALAGCAGAAIAAVSGSVAISSDLVLVAGIGAVAMAPILTRLSRGCLDIFEPVVITSATLLLLFVARPIHDILVKDYRYLGGDISDTYGTALLAALVAAVAFQVAYHTPLPASVARGLPKPPAALHDDTVVVAALALTAVAALFVLWFTVLQGGAATLVANRNIDVRQVAPFIGQGFLVALPAIPLFLLVKSRGRVLVRALAVLPTGIILLVALPAGNRRFLLPLLVVLAVFYFLRKGKRPSLPVVVIACALSVLLVVTPARASRTGEVSYRAALMTSVGQPLESFGSLLASGDTEMVDTIALEIRMLREDLPFRHGLQFLADTVLLPIPRELWAGKPDKMRTLVLQSFGTDSWGRPILRPTLSLVGDLYADFGLASVAVGSAIFGVLVAAGYQYLRLYPDNPVVQAAYSAGLWGCFYAWWSGFHVVTLFGVLLVGPVVLTAVLAGRRNSALATTTAPVRGIGA